MAREGGRPPTRKSKRTRSGRPQMPALVEAVTIKDLLSIRDLLEREAKGRLRNASPGLAASCTMVCLMWSMVLTSASSGIRDAESIARCMLVDTLTLLKNA